MRQPYKAGLFLFAISTIPFVPQFHALTVAYLFLLTAVSIFFEIRSLSLSKYLRGLFIISYLGALYISLGNLWSLEAGVSFLSFLALLKSFELRESRDLFVFSLIVQLSLVGHLLSVDDLYMVLVLTLIILNLFWLLYHFHHFAQKRKYAAVIGRYRRKVFIQIILWSLPLTLILFLIFPRIPLGNIFMNTMKKQDNMTGFTDRLRPGEISQVIQNQATYFRAQFKKLRPPPSALYWRGMVLTKTDGFNWDRALIPSSKLGRKGGQLPENGALEIDKEKILYNYNIEYEFFSNGPLFLLDRPDDFNVSSRSHTVSMGADTFYTVAYRNQKIRYQASSIRRNLKQDRDARPMALTAAEEKIYTRLGEKSQGPRFDQWLDLKGKGITEPEQLFSLLQNYFDKEGFSYSLSPGVMDPKAALDDFFFNKKVGLCEHYASILAYSLRRLHFPARVVVGFQGGQYNPYGEYFYIQGKNAHSWVEYWSATKGWQRADPTEWIRPDRIRLGPDIYFLAEKGLESINLENGLNFNEGDFYQSLLLMADMLYFELNREFLNFDFERQEKIFEFMKLKGKAKYLKLLAVAMGVMVLGSLALVFFIYRQKRPPLNAVEKSIVQLRKLLEGKGMELPSWWGPQRMSREVAKQFPEVGIQIREFCEAWEELSYQKSGGRGQKKELLIKLRAIKRQMRQN